MTTLGLATFLSVRASNYTTVVDMMQNYWPGQTVDGHRFVNFTTDSLISNSSGGSDSVTVSLPISTNAINLLTTGGTAGNLIELRLRSFAPLANGGVPTAFTTVAEYIGQIAGGQHDMVSVRLQVGAILNSTDTQAPPRRFSTALVGTPPKR